MVQWTYENSVERMRNMKESLHPYQTDENATRKDCGQVSPITDFEIEDGVLKEYRERCICAV